MSNATAAAPVRAHQATSKAKAAPVTPAPATNAPPKRVVSDTSRAASSAASFASVLMSQIVGIDDLQSIGPAGDLFIQAESFISALAYGDEADQPINVGNEEVTRATVMLEAALEAMEASVDTSPHGTALLIATLAHEALDVLRRISAALEVSPATLAPLKELDTYAGVRPRREQPRPQSHRAEPPAEDPQPLDLHNEFTFNAAAGFQHTLQLPPRIAQELRGRLGGIQAVTSVLMTESDAVTLGAWMRGGLLDALYWLSTDALSGLDNLNTRAQKAGAA